MQNTPISRSLVLAAALVAASFVGFKPIPAAAQAAPAAVTADTAVKIRYVCPMGEYEGDKPGKCPKCGMKLVEKKVAVAAPKDAAKAPGHECKGMEAAHASGSHRCKMAAGHPCKEMGAGHQCRDVAAGHQCMGMEGPGGHEASASVKQ